MVITYPTTLRILSDEEIFSEFDGRQLEILSLFSKIVTVLDCVLTGCFGRNSRAFPDDKSALPANATVEIFQNLNIVLLGRGRLMVWTR